MSKLSVRLRGTGRRRKHGPVDVPLPRPADGIIPEPRDDAQERLAARPAAPRAVHTPVRPMSAFVEAADLSADLVREELGVDLCLVVRIVGTSMAVLGESPRLPLLIGTVILPGTVPVDHASVLDSDDELIGRIVRQISGELEWTGCAGAGIYGQDGRLLGVLAAFDEQPFTGDPAAFAHVLRRHADELGPMLEREIATRRLS